MYREKRSRIARNKAEAFEKYKAKWGFTDYTISAYASYQLVFAHKDTSRRGGYREIRSVKALVERKAGGYVYPPDGEILTFKSLDDIKEYMLLRKLSGI